MRVLHVITGLGAGGAEAALFRLLKHDAANEHSVVSLTSDGLYADKLRELGVSVTSLGMSMSARGLLAIRGLWKVLRQCAPDIVQTWMYHADLVGGVLARMVGIPVIWSIRQTSLSLEHTSRRTVQVAWLCARLSRFVPQAIVSCSLSALTAHTIFGYRGRRLVVIPNGYDLNVLSPDPVLGRRFRAEVGATCSRPLLGCVARLDPAKDHDNLIEACRELMKEGIDFQLALVGSGLEPTNKVLVEKLAAAGLSGRTALMGFRSDISAVMSGLDIHVLSSSAEAFPNVLAEAMACGTPCVTTDVGDAVQIVGDAGWVVPPRDPLRLASGVAAACLAWRDKEAWGRVRAAARSRISEEFLIDKMASRFNELWEEVLRMSRANSRSSI